ncbi:MarR family transcriptional regulator [Burkholderia gladioli]|uniref:MarR family transcriptional regulator n=1 Tax=Burkholderia gladioli TaxID=28095 RepID=UPI0026533B7A|nr:MarR family transcriptional regulator [Burkholderia gladioli]MDN7919306.1 MarR family transcriptional regulator [Burkholderia gladioli]
MNDIHALIIRLQEVREALLAPIRPILNEYSLTEQQWRILWLLESEAEQGLEAVKIAKQCCILQPSLTRILERLERDGLITRKQLDSGVRGAKIQLTVRSQSLIARVQPRLESQYQAIERQIGLEKLRDLCAALLNMQKVARDRPDLS